MNISENTTTDEMRDILEALEAEIESRGEELLIQSMKYEHLLNLVKNYINGDALFLDLEAYIRSNGTSDTKKSTS